MLVSHQDRLCTANKLDHTYHPRIDLVHKKDFGYFIDTRDLHAIKWSKWVL